MLSFFVICHDLSRFLDLVTYAWRACCACFTILAYMYKLQKFLMQTPLGGAYCHIHIHITYLNC